MANTKIQIKRSVANTAPVSLSAGELAYSYASNTLFIGSSDGSQILNVSKLASQSAFDQANTANSLAQSAFDAANSASSSSTDQYARDTANSAGQFANTGINNAASASLYANTGIDNAASASLYANTGINDAASASLYANTGINDAASASLYANTGINDAASASAYANTGIAIAGAAFDQANAANSLAQSAFNAANNVVSSFNIAADSGTTDTFSTGETLTLTGGDGVSTTVANNQVTFDVDNTVIRTTGNQTIDGTLAITGDLVVSGNTITQDVSTLVVEDSLIQLAANNSVSDSLDIGFFGQYNKSGSVQYTSLLRDASDGKYKLLTNGTEKPADGNTVNVSAFSTGTLVADIEATSVTVSGVNLVTRIDSAYDQANTATNDAASASLYANSGITLAQAAYNQGNSTAAIANTDFTTLTQVNQSATGGVSGGIITVPAVTVAANGRVTNLSSASSNVLALIAQNVSWPVANTTGSNGPSSVRIGFNVNASGGGGQDVIAIGRAAAQANQGNNAIAIGQLAGFFGQGANSVAIGAFAGYSAQAQNSIVLNGVGEDGRLAIKTAQVVTNSGLYIDPIRSASLYGGILYHDSVTKEITSSTILNIDSGYIGDVYISNNIITPLGAGPYNTIPQPLIINGELSVLDDVTVTGKVTANTLTLTSLSYLATPSSDDGIMFVNELTGEVKYSFTIDGGTF